MRALPLLFLLTACATTGTGSTTSTPAGPNLIDERLKDHKTALSSMKLRQREHQVALQQYENNKAKYELAVAGNLAATKNDKRAISTLQGLAGDVDRIGQELLLAVTQLDEALVARAEAMERSAEAQARLIDVESEFWGGKDNAAAHAVVEVKYLHEVDMELRQAQKDEQAALAALHAKEIAAWGVGNDSQARDVADQQLTELRTALEQSFAKLLDEAKRHDDAEDRLHRKIHEATLAKSSEVGAKLQLLVDRRAMAGKELAIARDHLKAATISRGEKRAHEMAYDSEFAVVLTSAFKTDKQRNDFMQTVAAPQAAYLDSRKKVQTEAEAVSEARKNLVTIEALIATLAY